MIPSMRHKSFGTMQCPAARGLERVGEWWSILILRDALHGLKRFDEFQQSLGIAPNMLARRLESLVEAGLLKRERYCERPPRSEYRLTERGRDFWPVFLALLAWGNRHFTPEGPSVLIADKKTGAVVDPVLVDRATGRELSERDFGFVPGPAANRRTRERLARAAERLPVATGARRPASRKRPKRTEARHGQR
jgi:DNA-binding HxlR family transcriptional regulator